MSSERATPDIAVPSKGPTPRTGRFLRRARSALRLSGRDKRLVAEAMAALLSARLRSGMQPFRTLARQIEGLVPPGTPPSHAPLAPSDEALTRDVRWAIRVTAPLMPFRAVCLQQAIAARAMLARRNIPSVMRLGVRHPAIGKMEAHAWLETGGIKVTGYPLDPAMAEVARFI